MFKKKKFITTILLVALVTAGVAAVEKPRYTHKNLKVLPNDISDAKLDSIMHVYTIGLGVNCKFCHSELKSFPGGMDYASDENSMKENARDMMRMVIDINKKYFNYDSTQRPEYLHVITCKNCHLGQPLPPE